MAVHEIEVAVVVNGKTTYEKKGIQTTEVTGTGWFWEDVDKDEDPVGPYSTENEAITDARRKFGRLNT